MIAPALNAGKTVICDRFHLSTLVYQGLGQGISFETVQQANSLIDNAYNITPTLTIVLDLPVNDAMARFPVNKDRIEVRGIKYFEQVRNGYRHFAAWCDTYTSRYIVVDATGTKEQVAARIRETVTSFIP